MVSKSLNQFGDTLLACKTWNLREIFSTLHAAISRIKSCIEKAYLEALIITAMPCLPDLGLLEVEEAMAEHECNEDEAQAIL